LEKEFDIVVEWKGFELHPETPAGGILLERLLPGYKNSDQQGYMRNFAASFGVEDMASPASLPNTRHILAMAEYARKMGKIDTFRALAMQARWRDSRDLESISVLGDLAVASGLDPQKALAASNSQEYLARVDSLKAEAERMGINGIPTFIIGDERVVGCQPYQILATAVIRAGGALRE
jgi:predicted DsbA family dithiol-disulfide isomerase